MDVVDTLQILAADRGLPPFEPHTPSTYTDASTSFRVATGSHACCLLALIESEQCNSSLAKQVIDETVGVNATQVIIVTSGTSVDITPSASKLLSQLQSTTAVTTVSLFCSLNLIRPYAHHKLVPRHRRVPPEEVDPLLAQYLTCRAELGRLSTSDAIAKWYGFAVGDIITIEREGYGTTAPSMLIERVVAPGY